MRLMNKGFGWTCSDLSFSGNNNMGFRWLTGRAGSTVPCTDEETEADGSPRPPAGRWWGRSRAAPQATAPVHLLGPAPSAPLVPVS